MEALLPHLFRTEYRKLTAVLARLFGFEHLEIAEDIAADTFLAATEIWAHKGLPENPVAWLYTVAKNKAKDYLKRDALFRQKISVQVARDAAGDVIPEPDLSPSGIADSQLQMMFAVCHPSIPVEAQVGLALRVLCGFGIDEIAAAFLAGKDTINKRLSRAREKLRAERVEMILPEGAELTRRLDAVLSTLYLLFNEGYYAYGRNTTIRKDLCLEAMRLTHSLTEHEQTAKPPVFALLALMCFHASRLDARLSETGASVLYEAQDAGLWDTALIANGSALLLKAAAGEATGRYQIEAGIAWWHTQQADTSEKWANILQLYDQLLLLEHSPMAALNRTYALYKVRGKEAAIAVAEALNMKGHHLYHSLLGTLYEGVSISRAISHLEEAIRLSPSSADKAILMERLRHYTS